MKSKMTSYDFFPFVKPAGTGTVVFPNYDTIMKREDIILKPSTQPEKVEEKKENIDDLSIDFGQLDSSRGRQTKTSGGYTHGKLRDLGKDLRMRGYTIDFTSKDSLIDSIALLK